jgi:DNA-binding transcriptional regulator YiaG
VTIKEICEKYGFSQTGLAKRFGIPLRTVQNWAGGQRPAPTYVVSMMVEILEHDREKSE